TSLRRGSKRITRSTGHRPRAHHHEEKDHAPRRYRAGGGRLVPSLGAEPPNVRVRHAAYKSACLRHTAQPRVSTPGRRPRPAQPTGRAAAIAATTFVRRDVTHDSGLCRPSRLRSDRPSSASRDSGRKHAIQAFTIYPEGGPPPCPPRSLPQT